MKRLAWRVLALFRRARLGRELDDEIAAHLELAAADHEARGLRPDEARRAALRQFGGVASVKDRYLKIRGFPLLDTIARDIRYALRGMRRNPGFTAVVALTMTLGIGVNTAMFSAVYGVLLRPLPYPDPDRLVALDETETAVGREPVSYLDLVDWQRGNHSFTQLAGWVADSSILKGPNGTEYVRVLDVSADFFSVLGTELRLGRLFLPEEDRQAGRPVTVIGHEFWEQHLAGNPQALGQELVLNGNAYTIVGVLPSNFRFFRKADVYIPLGQGDPSWILNRKIRNGIDVIGRLKPGISLEQARADMGLLQRRLAEAYPGSDQDVGIFLAPLKQDLVGGVQRTLMLLMLAVSFVLLIACANAANLMLARSAARGREFAIRIALGAGRGRLISQLLAESTLIGLLGGAMGLAIAEWGPPLALAILPEALPQSREIGVDSHVLVFALGISIITGILFGLGPSLLSSQTSLQERLKDGARGSDGRPHRIQRALIVVETSLTLILLVAAGLMIRTIASLWQTDPGFNPRGAFTFSVALAPQGTSSPEKIRLAFHRLVDQVGSVPGVESAGLTNMVPLGNITSGIGFWTGAAGAPPAAEGRLQTSLLFITTPGYFRALEIPLLRGRSFAAADTLTSPHVVVVDDVLARQVFPGTDPLGKRINLQFLGPAVIVGVAGHVKHWGLAADANAKIRSEIYFPFDQLPDNLLSMTLGGMALVVRTPSNPLAVIPSVRRALMGPGNAEALFDARTMAQVIGDSTAGTQFPSVLIGLFSGLALLLASVGIYGLVSYSARRRTHEIGVRMALGAQKSDVVSMILGEGLCLALIGVAIGLVGAFALARSLSGFLYDVKPADPLTFAAASVLLVGVALSACYIPAHRAATIDSMESLRYE